jgi:two-component system, cell cycle response regulator CpdR
LSSTASNIKVRILVVDDEPDILLTLSSILGRRGHYVKTFDKPRFALEHLASEGARYDLVITDYRMPGGISGLDLAKTAKKKARKAKVFLMTAFDISAISEVDEMLRSKIVDKILQKPISNDKLIAVIEKSFLHNNH